MHTALRVPSWQWIAKCAPFDRFWGVGLSKMSRSLSNASNGYVDDMADRHLTANGFPTRASNMNTHVNWFAKSRRHINDLQIDFQNLEATRQILQKQNVECSKTGGFGTRIFRNFIMNLQIIDVDSGFCKSICNPLSQQQSFRNLIGDPSMLRPGLRGPSRWGLGTSPQSVRLSNLPRD